VADFLQNHRGSGAAATGFAKFIAAAAEFFLRTSKKTCQCGPVWSKNVELTNSRCLSQSVMPINFQLYAY